MTIFSNGVVVAVVLLLSGVVLYALNATERTWRRKEGAHIFKNKE